LREPTLLKRSSGVSFLLILAHLDVLHGGTILVGTDKSCNSNYIIIDDIKIRPALAPEAAAIILDSQTWLSKSSD